MGWRLLPIRANGPRQLRHAFLPFACPPPDLFYFYFYKVTRASSMFPAALHATMQPIGPSIGDARSVARCRSHWLQTSRAVQQLRAYQLVSYPRTTPPGQLPGRSARCMMPNLGATPHPPLWGDLSHKGRGVDGAARRSLLGSFCQIGATSPVEGKGKRRQPAHRLSPGGRGRMRSSRVRGRLCAVSRHASTTLICSDSYIRKHVLLPTTEALR
jgi:hypothetical protein